MGTGHDSTRLARAAVADCASRLQASRAAHACAGDAESPIPWAVFSKIHDSTKLEVTVPEDWGIVRAWVDGAGGGRGGGGGPAVVGMVVVAGGG